MAIRPTPGRSLVTGRALRDIVRTATLGSYGVTGFAGGPVGRLIDLGYGRAIMTGGSVLAGVLLALWSQTDSYVAFLLIWFGLGMAMSAVLYEPAFAVLAGHLGLMTRRGITFMTLVAGFASTVFIPLTHLLIESYGWRGALLVLGVGLQHELAHLVLRSGITRRWPKQRKAAPLTVDRVLTRGKRHVPAVAGAALPDREANQLQTSERTFGEMQLRIG